MEKKWLPISIVCLSVSILVSSIYVGNSLKSEKLSSAISTNMSLNNTKNQDILTVLEAAKFLDVNSTTVYSLVESSKYDEFGIPYYNLEGEIRFSKVALAQWQIQISNRKYEYKGEKK